MSRFLLMLLVSGLILVGCTVGGKVSKTSFSASQLYQKGDYQGALDIWEAEISKCVKKGQADNCTAYTPAAYAYMKLGNNEKALDLLKKASYASQVSDSTYLALATLYQQKDNLSLELMALKDYKSTFPQGKKLNDVNVRLFKLYVESQNWEDASLQWNSIVSSDQSSEAFLNDYFTINKAIQNKGLCDSIAVVLLQQNASNTNALDWLGKKYYRQAEDAYQSEMKAYEAKKTRKQYAKLLKALERVTGEFKTSLKYFKKLYQVAPSAKTANYLSHIYNRLDDKKKADYYGKLAEK